MFLNPQYSDAYLNDYYSSYVGLSEATNARALAAEHRARYQIYHHYMSLVERRGRKGTLLAVGCGDGLEICVANERGWEAEGFDVDPVTTASVSARLGVKVLSGDFPEVPYARGSFECVFLNQVLEHPKNPQAYLRTIRDVLAPEGIVFIACPNIESVSSRLKIAAGRLGLKKRRGKHYDTWHHLFYYSPAVLKGVIERYFGFRVLHIENGFGDKARGFSDSRIRREIVMNRFLPCWKDVFVLMATTD